MQEEPLPSLLDFIVDNRGRSCPTAPMGTPLIATNCIRRDQLYPTFDTIRYVDEETYSSWFRSHPEPDDIIFVCKGDPGRTALVPDPVPFAIAQDMVALRPNRSKISGRYLLYALRSPVVQDRIANMHVGTMIPHFKKGDFGKLLVPVHESLHEQQAIAEVLGALDDKIAANTSLVRRADDYAVNVLLSSLSDRRVRLGDIADITMGSSPKGDTLNELEDGIPFYQGVRDFGERWPSRRVYTTSPVRLAQEGDVLVSVRAPVGQINVASEALCIGRGLAALSSRERRAATLFHTLRAEHAVWEPFEAEGTVFGSINRDQLRGIGVRAVEVSVAESVERALSSIEDAIRSSLRESRILADTRDALLPQLMSGKLRVRDAERLASEAGA